MNPTGTHIAPRNAARRCDRRVKYLLNTRITVFLEFTKVPEGTCKSSMRCCHANCFCSNTTTNHLTKHVFSMQSRRCLCQVSHLLVASIGIGSACFHCTLRHVEQQCDETPMVLGQLNWFHELFADTWESNSLASAVVPVFLAIYGMVGG